MSLFIDFPVEWKSSSEESKENSSGQVRISAWSQLEPVVALALSDQSIRIVNEEGEEMEDMRFQRSGSNVRALEWRPKSRNLSVGWEDGTVGLWNLRDKALKDENQMHSGAITIMRWTPDGSSLISGDSSGIFCVWKTDYRSRLCNQAKVDIGRGNALTHAVWLINSSYHDAQRDLPTAPKYVFIGTSNGKLLLVDMKGTIVLQVDCENSFSSVLWLEQRQQVVALTSSSTLLQITCDEANSEMHISNKFRLSLSASASKSGIICSTWTRAGLLATCASENIVRIWDLISETNYVLQLPDLDADDETISYMDFNSKERLLAVSTNRGHVIIWRYNGELSIDEGHSATESSVSDWEHTCNLASSSDKINGIQWATRDASLIVQMSNSCSIMNQAVLHRTLRSDVAALQISAQKLLVQRGGSSKIEATVGLRIKGVDVSDMHVLVWNQKKAEAYQFADEKLKKISSFPTKAWSMALFGETIFQTAGDKIEVCNLQGVVRTEVLFSEHEGEPLHLHINNKYLAVATSKGLLKVFDVSRREPKLIGAPSFFARQDANAKTEKLIPIGEIRSIRCNANGTQVSILSDRVRAGASICEPDTALYVWNMDKDEFREFQFGPSRYPISHTWDGAEPRLLACEAKRLSQNRDPVSFGGPPKALPGSRLRNAADAEPVSQATTTIPLEPQETEEKKRQLQKLRAGRKISTTAEVEVATLFATDESIGVVLQDSFPMDAGLDALLGIKVPRLFFISKAANGVPKLKGKTMRDFVGLDGNVDEDTKRALIDFSYYLTIGNMDEAYRAIKLIDNVSVWENMAHMCVKTQRQDVAEMCIGNMGHARGARALRESKESESEPRVHIAAVAIQLGLLDEAEKLYIECERYDLLNKMFRCSGQWTKALEVANAFDRIHLRETHFEYAQYLESLGDFHAAIANYEASGTHFAQVPRMLFQAGDIEQLEMYVESQGNVQLTQWWGQYCESIGEFDRALHVYQITNDAFSRVRLLCFLGKSKAAADVAMANSNPAASYHLAALNEQEGNIEDAIQFYSRAGRYNHAVRLAKEHGQFHDIVNHALRADKTTMIDAARFLEQQGLNEDAVQLYNKGGNVARALDLCFRAELFDLLTTISDSINISAPGPGGERPASTGNSPEILNRCADFFIKHGKYDKAVNLYISGGFYEQALDMCSQNKVTITEEMAESMTLEKASETSGMSKSKMQEHNNRRQSLLEGIAKVCKKQQSYHLATKKYTQAGDRLKAMKCLLRSGDTEKIIFFAGVSRNREIYILAANFLQNLDWRNDTEVMKAIVNFYSKAKAYKQLASFYEACAQMEIDEYRDYNKAVAAYKESIKYLNKSKGDADASDYIDNLQQRISLIERYVQARKLLRSEPDEGERICHSLLSYQDISVAVRIGDIYSMLIEHYYNKGNIDQAHQLIERMRSQGVDVGAHLDKKMLHSIASHVGIDSYVAESREREVMSGDEIEDDDDMEAASADEQDASWGYSNARKK